ncbi:4626_t:CDS:1, partial [Funneliformis mosseae]
MDDNELNDDFSEYIDVEDSLSRLSKAASFTTISKRLSLLESTSSQLTKKLKLSSKSEKSFV